MPTYAHANAASPILSYECGLDWIDIRFKSGARYKYTVASAGLHNIEEMQRLAERGQGLSTYISQHAHNCYARKWD